jgi:hypothetical protein
LKKISPWSMDHAGAAAPLAMAASQVSLLLVQPMLIGPWAPSVVWLMVFGNKLLQKVANLDACYLSVYIMLKIDKQGLRSR